MRVELADDRPRLTVELEDGGEALIAPLSRDDRHLLMEGLEELSVESRYTRFGQGLSRLSRSEIDYLADVDQKRHVAWGVAVEGNGAGVGRYITVPEQRCAEIAVTVLDEFQRRGLGTLLFEALTAVARVDGVGEFCFEVMPDNVPVSRMIEGFDVVLDDSESTLLGRLTIDDIPLGSHEGDFVTVMNRERARLAAHSSSRSSESELTQ